MLPAISFSLVFLLASSAEGRSLTGCLFSDGRVYPPGEFSPARCTRCTCMTTQVSPGRNTYLPICVSTCDPDARDTVTIPTTGDPPTTTPQTTIPWTTTFPWTTTTSNLPCWAYLRFTCPDLDCQGHGSVPHDYANCRCGYCLCPEDPSSQTTSRPWSCPTTIPPTTRTTVPFTWPTTTTPTTAATTPMLPCWDYLRFTCPDLDCQGHGSVPHDYANCRCGYCLCPTEANSRPWSCDSPTTIPTTTIPFTWPTTATTTPMLPCRDYLRFTCPTLNCPDAIPNDYANCVCGYCPNGPATTVPTTIPTTAPTTTPPFLTTTTTSHYGCWHHGWKFTCPYYKPCVDATPDDYANCRCGQCPNGPNCYAWDGTIISAGEAVEVDGATCQCNEWFGSSHFADCDFGALTG
ncbi:Hypp3230 [Branchiostoma lanceolatum]|uniref:Hypp3230 protein n=1 Tax=Branchiostoma lanceolatum TaxID=7740 RepID=A0A8K0EWE4_BRALA|nr:Hypp3230 [Branchiostoma lanceolatum]